jgi:replicative DNA helicase
LEGIYKSAIDEIKRNRERRLKGLVNSIPFSLKRFNEIIPGIQRENYTIVTASSGVGKSKITKRLYVIDPIDFVLANPQMNIKLDIFYFCLEESKQRFIQSLMCSWIYKNFSQRVPIKLLLSKTDIVDEHIIKTLEENESHFRKLENILHLYDDIRNPYGIYREVETFLEKNGTWSKKTIQVPSKERKGELESILVRDTYTANHSDHYVMVVVDHMSLLHPEKAHNNSLHAAMSEMSSNHFLRLRDKYHCTIVAVQQQEAAKEKQQYTYKGQSIEAKLEPSLDGLGDNKLTGRDANEVLGLFAPDRYEIKSHRGYNVELLEDNYRSLMVLKSRDGESNARVGLFFDGAVNHFEELPKADEMYEDLYARYLERVERMISVNFG